MAARILIADDNPILCELLSETLEDEGYSVDLAYDGFDVITRAQEQIPDLFLIDLLMPGMDGYETIRQIRNDTRMSYLPIIVLTAATDMQAVVTGFESGADDYITKPFHTPELLARIKAQLERAKRRPVQNPLTGLPGNVLIEQEINHFLRIKEPFALLYVDLNNFKAFNDIYGFARGDMLIQLVARILNDLREEYHQCFVGHIGGDDFTVLLPYQESEAFCIAAIHAFEQQIRQIKHDEEHAPHLDHHGQPLQNLPQQTLSIGVVHVRQPSRETYTSLSRRAAKIKAQAKQRGGNTYAIDQGTDEPVAPQPSTQHIRLIGLPEALAARITTLVQRQRWQVVADDDLSPSDVLIVSSASAEAARLRYPDLIMFSLTLTAEQVSHLTVDIPLASDLSLEQYLTFALHLKQLEVR